jgi:Zn-dependent protease with chaperone function
MKNFFEHQAAARRKTGKLLLYFILAIGGIIFALYSLIGTVVVLSSVDKHFIFYHQQLFIAVAGCTLLVIALGSLFRIYSLRNGGSVVAAMLNGKLLPANTSDPRERRLLNVVEEMAIASGIPVPIVFLMEKEQAINALAAGFTPDTAVIGITRGAVDHLNRDELQGVVAHEFSHIFNGDMLLNIRMMGLLHGILMISQSGDLCLRSLSRGRGGRGTAAIFFLGLGLYLAGSLGLFAGKLIKSAVARQREFLADASAVQYTRNPFGLAGALKKIGGWRYGARLRHPLAAEASHLYFGNGLTESWIKALNTHPPLAERVRRLDPSFSGVFPEFALQEAVGDRDRFRAPLAPEPGQALTPQKELAPEPPPRDFQKILDTVGEPMLVHVARARQLIGALPAAVKDAAREPFGSRALIYGLLLDRSVSVRKRQLTLLREKSEPGVYVLVQKLRLKITALPRQAYLPLVDLALPALRTLSPAQYQQFKENVAGLSAADKTISLFEFVLHHCVLRHLAGHFRKRKQVTQIYNLRGAAKECSCLLSALARLGHRDEGQAGRAFEAGRKIIAGKAAWVFSAAGDCTLYDIDQALRKLAGLSPPLKKKLLAACLECITYDQQITSEESELFRVIADALGCPVPLWLSGEEGKR